MEFLQDPIFTAFLAIVLSYLVAKVVSFAVSNSSPDVNSVAREVGAEKVVILDKGLEVRRGKGEKRVKFVDDVVIRRVDRYEGSENLDVGNERVDSYEGSENLVVGDGRFDQFGGELNLGERESEGECCGERELDDCKVEGSEKIEMLFENVVKSVGDEREGNEEKKVSDDMVIDEREGDEEKKGIDEREGDEEKKVSDGREESDDDWEGVERSELERGFAEAVNYVECGGKGREGDRLARLGSDVQMQLYGLHKVALEGPCLDPQPMALMLSARTKWYLIFIWILILQNMSCLYDFIHVLSISCFPYDCMMPAFN